MKKLQRKSKTKGHILQQAVLREWRLNQLGRHFRFYKQGIFNQATVILSPPLRKAAGRWAQASSKT